MKLAVLKIPFFNTAFFIWAKPKAHSGVILIKEHVKIKTIVMIDLGSWMNKILIGWGVDPKIANTFDESIIAILMIFIAVGLDYLCQAIFVC